MTLIIGTGCGIALVIGGLFICLAKLFEPYSATAQSFAGAAVGTMTAAIPGGMAGLMAGLQWSLPAGWFSFFAMLGAGALVGAVVGAIRKDFPL